MLGSPAGPEQTSSLGQHPMTLNDPIARESTKRPIAALTYTPDQLKLRGSKERTKDHSSYRLLVVVP